MYEIFEKGGHRITIRSREGRFPKTHRFFNEKQLKKILDAQLPDEDIYIEKYPKSRLVQVIILDLDSEDDIELAHADATRLKNYMTRNGHNTVIVESGSKGYHVYIQIPPFLFKNADLREWNDFDYSLLFNQLIYRMLEGLKKEITTLDEINFKAGLNGNIRVIGSTHPKTGRRCRIIDGEFIPIQEPTSLFDTAIKRAYNDVEIFIENSIKKKKQQKVKLVGGVDPIEAYDLREVFERLTGEVKVYPSGYAYCRCPFHSPDKNPSMLVTENFYSCSACEEKGNIWTLRKKGLVSFTDDGELEY